MYKHEIKEIKSNLKKLKEEILNNRELIYEALKKDLNKNPLEAEATEVGQVLNELNLYIRKLKRWWKNKRVTNSIQTFYSKTYIKSEPYGNVLIVCPWNYPFNLSLVPVINAIGAGNNVILKLSELCPNTNQVVKKILTSVFNSAQVKIYEGDKEIVEQIYSENKIDFIFFTGSEKVGQIYYKKAAELLIPCVLELGGKSPLIVGYTADMEEAANKLVLGKLLNAGQTCIAPDYVLVHKEKKEELIREINNSYHSIFKEKNAMNENIARIVNKEHYDRLVKLAPQAKRNEETLQFDLNILELSDNTTQKVMSEEIFGPLLPIITFNELDDAVKFVNSKSEPLTAYLFTRNSYEINKVTNEIKAGSIVINDILLQLQNRRLAFGGRGKSGIGKYRGKAGFNTFTHKKAIICKTQVYKEKRTLKILQNKPKILKLLQFFNKWY
ncbi:aldehyde dehydrogenase family protein [Mycoplasma sp. 21DD0573]|uniref:aldehyde dehydrogenase family protein n=1 Tax=unclassified Mycoplasma TaxID=2683645 RepID=UPI002B1E2EFD|nr:aldehyde dehydrogenase family protein [Mycoplasma sp. 21DD0573]MEA4276455.1 aldehyde dehydrogenase family protein [Mycoplasma sp. 21DD0573]